MSIQVAIANNTPKIMIFKFRWFLIEQRYVPLVPNYDTPIKKALLGKEFPSQGSLKLARCL